MREIFRMTCPGEPIPQPRQKHRIAGGKRKPAFVQNYTERNHPVQAYKEALRAAAEAASLPGSVLAGAIKVELIFYHSRPRSLNRAKDPDGPMLKATKPDYDNLSKAVFDAMKSWLWGDDSQVVGYTGDSTKYYCEKGGSPRTVLAIFLP